MATRQLTRSEARAALGDMPERTFARWCAAGMPVKGQGEKAKYPWPEIFRWLLDQVERRGSARQKPGDAGDEARNREAAARADMAELDLARSRAELMTVADYDRVVGNTFQRVRAQLQSLSSNLAPAVVGVESIPEALEQIEPVIADLMAELYHAKDVPAPSRNGKRAPHRHSELEPAA